MKVEQAGWYDPSHIDPKKREKYVGNLRRGRTGEMPVFTGYAEAQKKGISVRAFVDPDTLTERVIHPLEQIARENDSVLYPATLGAPHITIAEARITDNTPRTQQDAFSLVRSGEGLLLEKYPLTNGTIVFDTLWGGGAITLASTRDNPQIEAMRNGMGTMSRILGLQIVNYRDIVHTTVGRFASSPPTQEAAESFRRSTMRLHHEIVKDPVSLQVLGVEVMANDVYNRTHDRKFFESIARNNKIVS